MRRKTHEEFIEEMKVVNPNIEILGKYINTNTVILCRCKIDGHEWYAYPNNLVRGGSCPICAKNKVAENRRFTHEEFVKKLTSINPNIEVLGKYVNSRTKIKVKCKICGHIWEARANHLIQGTGCEKCYREGNRKNHEDFIKELFDANDKANTFDILEEYTTSITKIRCRCKICKSEWKTKPITLLVDKTACPVCANRVVVHGINDITTIRPDLLKYFVDQDEAKYYTPYSNHRSLLKCPDCGATKYMTLDMLASRGFSCNICNDKMSYPNKYLRGFLKQLPVSNIKYEYSPDWIKPHRYDGYFEYKGQAYIIEMDGGIGHGNHQYRSREKDIKGLERDKFKDKMAKSHNIIMIRIDCLKSDSNYISDNIKNSILKDIIDLSVVDWIKCDEFAIKNIAKEVCDYYKNNNSKLSELAKAFDLSKSTISNYLKRGTDFGWCNYCPSKTDIRQKSVNVFDINNTYLHNFDSLTQCEVFMKEKYNEKFNRHKISKVCSGELETYKGFVFKYAS